MALPGNRIFHIALLEILQRIITKIFREKTGMDISLHQQYFWSLRDGAAICVMRAMFDLMA